MAAKGKATGADTDRLRAVIATQSAIAATPLDLDQVMERVCDSARELTGATGAVVEMIEGEDLVAEAASGPAGAHLGLRLGKGSSLSGLCVRLGEVLRCDDADEDPRVDRGACRQVGAVSLLCVPLYHGPTVMGALKVYSEHANAFDDSDGETLEMLSQLIAAHITHATEHQIARDESLRDPLTGLYNRRSYEARLPEEVTRHARYGQPMALAVFDLDGFKQVNDRKGHPEGDRILREVAAHLASAVRRVDNAFRLGGDEFALLLPNTDESGAREVIDRVTERVAGSLAAEGVTISAGFATAEGGDTDPDALHLAADAALLRAKHR